MKLNPEQIGWHNFSGVDETLTPPAVLDFSSPSCPAYMRPSARGGIKRQSLYQEFQDCEYHLL